MYPGRWVLEQPGVKAPGTPKRMPFFALNFGGGTFDELVKLH